MKDMLSAIIRNDIGKVQELISSGFDVNTKGFQGYTPLMIAISWHRKEIIELLYRSGANSFDLNEHRRDAVDCAREYQDKESLNLFKGRHHERNPSHDPRRNN